MITTESATTAPVLNRLGDASLAERIEGSIERRTCGRVRDLRVVCTENLVILRGRARTYHAKQLAQEAALDLTGEQIILSNQIWIY
jgi:hypothetical protein